MGLLNVEELLEWFGRDILNPKDSGTRPGEDFDRSSDGQSSRIWRPKGYPGFDPGQACWRDLDDVGEAAWASQVLSYVIGDTWVLGVVFMHAHTAHSVLYMYGAAYSYCIGTSPCQD